jgi:cell division protein FtsL
LSVGAVIMLVLTVFCVAALQAYAAQVGFRVASLERQVTQAEQQTTLLQAREAQLETPERLADAATGLGLVADPSPRFLRAPQPEQSDDAAPGELDAIHKLLAP